MKTGTQLSDFLFFDIETCRKKEFFSELHEDEQEYWISKHQSQLAGKEDIVEEHWKNNGSFHAEWGFILCVSMGGINADGDYKIKTMSMSQGSEKDMLGRVAATFMKMYENGKTLTGWNIGNFDVPFLAKRMIKYGIHLPQYLRVTDTKPWESKVFDMAKGWEFGKWGSYTKFDMLCHYLEVESPKSDISGEDVGRIYYETQGSLQTLQRIDAYCEQDVRASMDVMKKIHPYFS